MWLPLEGDMFSCDKEIIWAISDFWAVAKRVW
jgi:hypothetical protein